MKLKYKKKLKNLGFLMVGLFIGFLLASMYFNSTLSLEEKIKRDISRKMDLLSPTFVIEVVEGSALLDNPDLKVGDFIVEDIEKIILYDFSKKEIIDIYMKPDFPDDLFEKLQFHLWDSMIYDIFEIDDMSIFDESDELLQPIVEKAREGHYIVIADTGMKLYDYEADEILAIVDLSEIMNFDDMMNFEDPEFVNLAEAELLN